MHYSGSRFFLREKKNKKTGKNEKSFAVHELIIILASFLNYKATIAQLVERRFCKPLVAGSNPASGSSNMGQWPSGQWHQTVNLTAEAYGGSNPSWPTFAGAVYVEQIPSLVFFYQRV